MESVWCRTLDIDTGDTAFGAMDALGEGFTQLANAAGGGHVGRRAAGTAAEARNTVSLFIFFPNRALSGTPRGG